MSPCTCGHDEADHDGPGDACSQCECMYYEANKNDGGQTEPEGEVWHTHGGDHG